MVAVGTWAPITALHSPSRAKTARSTLRFKPKSPGGGRLGQNLLNQLLNIPPTVIIAYRNRQLNGN
jgi:hypothetical protein